MRKLQKEQIEDFLKSLERAHGHIKKEIQKRHIPAALELLEECQNGAIHVGGLIEDAEGEDFVTIPMLEQYCELVYQIHESLVQERVLDEEQAYQSLRKQLLLIMHSVENDIKERIEAVFLPYKASMWDSLESVWRAAEEDPDCDAYVVPIPYYDRNPDGSLGEMHYEGNSYPGDVPVTWYGDYDLAERRPDMIYIHNPYDEYNYVTSVHPFFYAKNLKQFTDLLVYIPYFILEEFSLDNRGCVEDTKHNCLVPAVIHADKVVVQSENMRTFFINVLQEAMGKDQRGYLEEKIAGWGSPKVDRIRPERLSAMKIREEWMEQIGGKKVIFYNTSVGALLFWGNSYLEKMQMVFDHFKKRDDVVLLWRPHPLMETTLLSMRPEQYASWEKLKDEFVSDRIGILDTGADMYPAIAVSDAYYGDPSSVVAVYLCTGKPVWKHGFRKEGDAIFVSDVGDDLREEKMIRQPGMQRDSDGYETNGERIYKKLRTLASQGL